MLVLAMWLSRLARSGSRSGHNKSPATEWLHKSESQYEESEEQFES